MSSNVATVRSLYDAFARRDADALRAVLDADVEWIQCPGFPGGDRRRGVEEVLSKTFGALRSEWTGFQAQVEEYLDAGDTVVALGRYTGTHSVTGKAMAAVFAHVYDVRGGKITRYRQYTDTWPMVAAMRA
jgi:uncharacterized protein